MVHVKGLVLRARIDYIRKAHGDDAWARVTGALKPESRDALEGDILMSSWYPLSILIDLNETADRLIGRGDLALCRTIGAETARLALAGVQKSFAKDADPAFVIKMSPLLWSQYYDSGRVEVESTGSESALMRVLDFETPHPVICAAVLGWLEGAIGIWGGDVARVHERKCRTRGDGCCEYAMDWFDESQHDGTKR